MSGDSIRRQRSRYTQAPEPLIRDPRVSDRAFRLWCRLDRYAGTEESAYPSRESMAIEMDCSPSSIDRATKELMDAGWLIKEQRAGGTCLYTLVDDVPTKEAERVADAAREARKKATQPRRDKAAARRREQKRKEAAKRSNTGSDEQATEGGFITGDEPQNQPGFVTGDEPGFVMGDERGFVTGDEQKEATLEGSNIEGDSASSLRSESAAAEPDESNRSDTPTPPPADALTEQERTTGRDEDGKPLRGKKLTALAQSVTKDWWDWIEREDNDKPAQSFIACRQVVKTALANGHEPKKVKNGLAKITSECRAVSGGSLTIAMGDKPDGSQGMRRGYDDVATWGKYDPDAPVETPSEEELDALFGPDPTSDASTAAHG